MLLLLAAISLPACPDSPNCVSTQGSGKHAIAPIVFSGTPGDARAKLLSILRAMPRTKIVAADGMTVRAEFTTRLFRFVDDAVFVVDGESKTIHFRSASRVGYSDLGVNRRRMETIRKLFAG